LELADRLREQLAALETLMLEQPAFDPASARRFFHIAALDYVQVTLLGPLLQRLARAAPGIDFEIRQASVEAERDLDAGVLDLLIRPQQPAGPGVVWTPLYQERYTSLVWKDHPVQRLTLAGFAAMEHVLVAPRERPGGIVDAVLEKNKLPRRVGVQAPTFLFVPYLLAGTERVATVPERMAKELVRLHPLKILKPPVEIP
jgi:LysR family transcriptional regulator, nod-box dependent transcriptional activator